MQRYPLLLKSFRSFSMKSNGAAGPLERSIQTKLTDALQPSTIHISNDSWRHRHHAPMKKALEQGEDIAETHFSLQIVSEAFAGKSTMQRHRMIYAALVDELAAGLHSITLKTKTLSEMEEAGPN